MNARISFYALAFVFMSLFLNGAAVFACEIILGSRPPVAQDQPLLNMQTKEHRVTIDIKDGVAHTTVEATFYNPNRFEVEGTYFFPLDVSIALSSFSMFVNGKEMKAELLGADQARNIYESIVRRRKDPALLEFLGSRLLQARVFPILPTSDVKIKLSYSHVITSDEGLYHYRYPFVSARSAGGPIGQVVITAKIKSGIPIKNIYSPSHPIGISRPDESTATVSFEGTQVVPEKDFDLYFSVSDKDIGLTLLTFAKEGEDGYFLLMLSPKVEVSADKGMKKDIVFVFDTSGSMSGIKIQQARNALKTCVSNLSECDRFNVITFSTDVRPFYESLVSFNQDTLADTLKRIEKIEAIGGTNINDALLAGLDMLAAPQGAPMIVFMTDGIPTVSETDIEKILANVKAKNSGKARIFVFGVGNDVNTKLLDRIAEENNGTRDYVREHEDIEVKVGSFFRKVANPVLSNVKLEILDIKTYDLYPSKIHDIFKGVQINILGRFQGKGDKTVKLTGNVGDKNYVFNYRATFGQTTAADFIPRLWATRRVAYLKEQIRLYGRSEELVKEIEATCKKYGIMSEYASFLIVEEGVAWDPVAVPRELERARIAFEEEDSGAFAVDISDELGAEKDGARVSEPSENYMAKRLSAVTGRKASEILRYGGDKAFQFKYGAWYDLEYDEEKHKDLPHEEVEYLSDQYFDLLARKPALKRYASVGENVIIVFEGKVYRIRSN